MPIPSFPTPLVIAHRGACGLAPENTSVAISTAIALGADMAEVDIQLCKDGHLVVFHDRVLKRTIRCPQFSGHRLRRTRIADLTLDEIRTLDAGAWWGMAFAEEPVPTLEDVLRLCTGQIGLNIEIKTNRTDRVREERCRIVAQLNEALTMFPGVSPVVLSSFDYDVLMSLHEESPLRLGVLTGRRGMKQALAVANRLRAYSVHVPCSTVTPHLVERIHGDGFRLYTYTANSVRLMRRLLRAGVDGIFTDYPDRLMSVVRPRDSDPGLAPL